MNKKKIIKIIALIMGITALVISSIFVFKVNEITKPQDNYAKYLVDLNNKFVREMYDFLVGADKVRGMEESEEKDALLSEINQYILNQDALAQELSRNSPEIDNVDYYDVANQINQTYLFMMQGEIGILEQMYLIEDERNDGVLKNNYAMQNVMGEIILQFPTLINEVRDTDYQPNYTYIPDENSITVTGIKDDKEYQQYLNDLDKEMQDMQNGTSNGVVNNIEGIEKPNESSETDKTANK